MADRLQVVVAWSPAPRTVHEEQLDLPAGSTVADALARSALQAAWPQASGKGLFVWGRCAQPAQPLRDGDRIEVLRGLRVDPKLARRERFQRQGARAAGLFARGRQAAPSASPEPEQQSAQHSTPSALGPSDALEQSQVHERPPAPQDAGTKGRGDR
ncbi:RnfH family protein [Ramlibacter sp. AN1015]|uniref:RnfH family protein n=1 Tax=Ramlibacter sp. AN1015 TaxID=3133428 RepID=UPI0030C597B5